MGRRRRCVAALLLAPALAASLPAAGGELWRSAAEPGPCRVALINELGGVDVRPDAEGMVLASGAPGLAVAAARGAGGVQLTVTDGGRGAAGDVALRVPPRCEVAVRTGSGAVRLELGPVPLPISVDTVTGEITLWVEPAAAAAIRLATSGEITTDYTIAIDFRYHEEPAKYARITVASPAADGGAGKAEKAPTPIRLASRRGAVRVLRQSADLR